VVFGFRLTGSCSGLAERTSNSGKKDGGNLPGQGSTRLQSSAGPSQVHPAVLLRNRSGGGGFVSGRSEPRHATFIDHTRPSRCGALATFSEAGVFWCIFLEWGTDVNANEEGSGGFRRACFSLGGRGRLPDLRLAHGKGDHTRRDG